jgi:phosphoribosylamine--glycine ligase
LAAENYPDDPVKGDVIAGLEPQVEGAYVLHAGTEERDGEIVSNGGRVLNVVGTGEDLAEARAKAYEAVARIRLRGAFHRTDIAAPTWENNA